MKTKSLATLAEWRESQDQSYAANKLNPEWAPPQWEWDPRELHEDWGSKQYELAEDDRRNRRSPSIDGRFGELAGDREDVKVEGGDGDINGKGLGEEAHEGAPAAIDAKRRPERRDPESPWNVKHARILQLLPQECLPENDRHGEKSWTVRCATSTARIEVQVKNADVVLARLGACGEENEEEEDLKISGCFYVRGVAEGKDFPKKPTMSFGPWGGTEKAWAAVKEAGTLHSKSDRV